MCRHSRIAFLVVLVLALSGCTVPITATAIELTKFEGTWVVTAAKIDGDDLPAQVGQEYTFAAGKLTIRQGERVLDTAKVVVDAAAKPKAVDLVSNHLRAGESSAKFIYEFDGEML